MLDKTLRNWVKQNGLPASYAEMAQDYLMPLSDMLIKQKGDTPLVIGISGVQGSGKSTLSSCLVMLLEYQGYNVAQLSLDDLYLNQEKRGQLAKEVHQLFKTRGVPGTHDIQLGKQVLSDLKAGAASVLLPRFDKQNDNPKPKQDWEICFKPVDFILFEGWCVGSHAQDEKELAHPINVLEEEEDKQSVWRSYVNQQLKQPYTELFALLDLLIVLQAPSFACVYTWRMQQEQHSYAQKDEQGMDKTQLKRFVQHFERLSRHNLKTLGKMADVVFELDETQVVTKVIYKS